MRVKDKSSRRTLAALILAAALVNVTAWGQTFSSGSTGADGDLIFPNAQPGQTIIFDPTTLNTPLAANHGSIYNFGVITIPKGVTIKLSGPNVAGPQYWLAAGAVDIEGTVDLSGAPGYAPTSLIADRIPSIPGVGGFPGGVGGSGGAGSMYPVENGQGPAGGATGPITACFGGAAYGGSGGGFSGNQFLVPLIGGSGGGGSSGDVFGAGGGAGGGAILIASSVSITIDGTATAVGGGEGGTTAGGGAGGAIRLASPTIQGNGSLSVTGGSGGNCFGTVAQNGIARLEAFNQLFSGTISGGQASGTPYNTFAPTSGSVPMLTVVSVNGVPVAANPVGSFTNPDVTFSASGSVPIVVNGANIPSGTQVNLQVYSENGPDIMAQGTLTGSMASSTATVMVNLPAGFSRGFISASFSSQSTNQAPTVAKGK